MVEREARMNDKSGVGCGLATVAAALLFWGGVAIGVVLDGYGLGIGIGAVLVGWAIMSVIKGVA